MKTICYVGGCGRLGSALAAWSAEKGYRVYCVDVNEDAVDAMNLGKWDSPEPLVGDLIDKWAGTRLFATTSYHVVADADIVFIIVPTPSEPDGAFSLKYILSAVDEMRAYLSDNTVVVIVSTVMPGDSERMMARLGTHHVIYSPEFIRQGSIVRDFANPDQVLIGETNVKAGVVAEEYYRSVVENMPVFIHMSLRSAEITKIALNSAVVTKADLANQVAWICHRSPSADAQDVLGAIGADSRIGPEYLRPGTPAASGPCFKRDNRALVAAADRVGVDAVIAKAVGAYRDVQLEGIAGLLTVGILGLTYKPGVDITEASQGIDLAGRFGCATVKAYDPQAVVPYSARTLEELVDCSDVLFLMVCWPEFKRLEEMALAGKVVVDMWGFFSSEKLNCAKYILFGRGE